MANFVQNLEPGHDDVSKEYIKYQSYRKICMAISIYVSLKYFYFFVFHYSGVANFMLKVSKGGEDT